MESVADGKKATTHALPSHTHRQCHKHAEGKKEHRFALTVVVVHSPVGVDFGWSVDQRSADASQEAQHAQLPACQKYLDVVARMQYIHGRAEQRKNGKGRGEELAEQEVKLRSHYCVVEFMCGEGRRTRECVRGAGWIFWRSFSGAKLLCGGWAV